MTELMNNIKNLREMTGAGFLDCKLALNENNHDVEKSIDYLRKKGLIKASKKSTREAKEGAVGLYYQNNKAIMIEINAETDFATKNETFLNFFDKIGNIALTFDDIENLSIDNFLSSKYEDKILSEFFTDIISKIGENIVLKKLLVITKNNDSEFFTYTHNSYRKNIGKICVLLKCNFEIESILLHIKGDNIQQSTKYNKQFAHALLIAAIPKLKLKYLHFLILVDLYTYEGTKTPKVYMQLSSSDCHVHEQS